MSSKALRMAVACAVSLTMTTAVIPAVYNLAGSPEGIVLAETAPRKTAGTWKIGDEEHPHEEEGTINFNELILTGDLTIDLQGWSIDFLSIKTNGYNLKVTSSTSEGSPTADYGYFGVGGKLTVNEGSFTYEVPNGEDKTFSSYISEISDENGTVTIKSGTGIKVKKITETSTNGYFEIEDGAKVVMDDAATIVLESANPYFDNYGTITVADESTAITLTVNDSGNFKNFGKMSNVNVITNDTSYFSCLTIGTPGDIGAGSTVTTNDSSSFTVVGTDSVTADLTINNSSDSTLYGTINGNVTINSAKKVTINGTGNSPCTINGDVTFTNGSSLVIGGTVNGSVYQSSDSDVVSLEIQSGAVLNNPWAVDFHNTASTIKVNGTIKNLDVRKTNITTINGATVSNHLTVMGVYENPGDLTITDSTIKWLSVSLMNLTISGSTVTDEIDITYTTLDSTNCTYKGSKFIINTDSTVDMNGDTIESETSFGTGVEATYSEVSFTAPMVISKAANVEFISCNTTADATITAEKSSSVTFSGLEAKTSTIAGKITVDGTPKNEGYSNTSITVSRNNFTKFTGVVELVNGAVANFDGGIFDEFIYVKSDSGLTIGNALINYGLSAEGDGTQYTTALSITAGASVFCPVNVEKAKLTVSGGTIQAEGNAIILDNAVDVKIYGGSFKSSNAYCIYDGGSTPSEKITVSGGTFDCGVNIDTPILSEGDCEDQNSLVKVLGGHFDTKVSPKFIPVNKLQIIDDNSDYSATPYTITRFEENLDYEVVAMTPADCCNPGNRLYLKSFYYGDYLPYDLQYSYREATEKDIVIPAEGHDYHDFDDATIDPANATWHYEYTAGTKQHFIDSAYVHLKCSKCGETIKVEDETPLLDPAHEGINTYRFNVVLKNPNHPDLEITNVKSIRYAPNVYMQVSAGSTFTVKLAYVFPIDYDSGDTDMLLYYISKFNGQEIDEFEDEITRVFNANIGEETGYIMSVTSPAKDMSNPISFEIESYDEEGAIVSDALSISDYAKMLINDTEGVFPGNNENVRNFCRAMLSYGHAAQDQFGTVQNPEDYADYGVTGTGIDYSGVVVPTEEFDKATLNEILASVDAPVSYYGMSATLKSNPYFTLVFKVTSGSQSDALTWVKNRINIAYVDKNTGRTPDIKVTKSGETYIKVVTPALKISEIDQLYGIRVLGASNTNRTIFGLDTFVAGVNAMKSSESKTTMLNLCKALINYYNYSQILIEN